MTTPSHGTSSSFMSVWTLRRAWRMPLDIATAALVVLCFVRFGFSGEALLATYLVVVLGLLTAIDLEESRLPNRVVLPSTAILLFGRLILSPDRAIEWLAAGVGAALFLFLPLLAYPNGMGLGDVKLALLLGVALGKFVVFALVIGCLGAALLALGILATRGAAARNQAFPFGPFLALGGVIALIFGNPLLAALG